LKSKILVKQGFQLSESLRIEERLYLSDTAQRKMQTHLQQSKQRFMGISDATIEQVKQRLEAYPSPEKLAGRIKNEGFEQISHETVYQMIYANHQRLRTY
jgi:transposase, IS30 family